MAVYKVNGTDISISNSSSSNNKVSTTYIRDNDEVITGDSYSDSWANYMIRAFGSVYKENGNDIDICKAGRRPATTDRVVGWAGTYDMTGDSSSGFVINGVNLGAGNEVFFLSMSAGGGSGAVGSGSNSGGGGGAGGGIHCVLIANSGHQIVIGNKANGASGKGSNGNNGNASYLNNNGTRVFTCNGGNRGTVGNGGSGGSSTVNDATLMQTYTGGYYSLITGGRGGSISNDGASGCPWTEFNFRPEAGINISFSAGSGVSGGAGGGGGSMFTNGTSGQKHNTASSSAGEGAGSGGTGYVWIGTPKNTGSGGQGAFVLYY